jgi:hypothetical protein
MDSTHTNEIVAYGPDGKQRAVVELTDKEFDAMQRAMQWPEDLAQWDRLNRVINGSEMGSPL